MQRLDEGRWVQLPDDENGGLRWWCLKAWIILASCDMPAAGSLVPWHSAAAAHHFCRQCTVDASNPDSKRPFSFLRQRQAMDERGAKRRRCILEHEWETVEQQLGYCKAIECDTARAAYCKSLGFNRERLEFAFHPSNFPHVDPATGLPQDALHLFPDGILRSEGAWLVYVLAKLGLTVASINEAMSRYSGWPPDVSVPPLSNKLTSGKEGGVPDSSTTLKMSGSQVMHFTLHR